MARIAMAMLTLTLVSGCGGGESSPDPAIDSAAGGSTARAGSGGASMDGAGHAGESGTASGGRGGESGVAGGGASGNGGGAGKGLGPTGGAGGGTGDGGFVSSLCRKASSTLPSGAPKLTAGTWVNISPAGVPFDATATAFGQAITLDPCNAGTLYLGVEGFDPAAAKAGLYKSTDAGSNWTKMGQLDEPINVVVDPEDAQHLYASDGVRGSTMGFWVSTDGGNTWTSPEGFKSTAQSVGACCDVYHVEPDPADFKHVLVSFHSPWSSANGAAGVLESFDGGSSWTAHQPVSGMSGGAGYGVFFLYDPALGIGDSKTWLYGCQGGKGHWRTTDAGRTWTQVTANSMEHGGNQIYYTKSGILYAGGFPNVMRSTDNGATWTTVSPNVNPAGYLSVIGDGKNLYTGLHNGPTTVVTSAEADGHTWATYDSQMFNEGPFGMAFDPVNGILYASMIRSGAWALKVKP